MNKWYMHNSASIQENETHKLLSDFEILTDHVILTRQLNLVIINKKKRTCRIVDFTVLADHRVKLKENENNDKYLNIAIELKKSVEHESDVDTNYNWRSWYNHQRIDTGTAGLGNNRTSRDHPNYSIIKISQNTDENSGDLRRLTVTQTPVRNYRLTLALKLKKKGVTIIIILCQK